MKVSDKVFLRRLEEIPNQFLNYGRILGNELNQSIGIEFTPEFKRNIRQLIKKYRSIKNDVQKLIDILESGQIIGDKIKRTDFNVYKVRVKNSDIQKGKSAGYRLIYYLVDRDKIILVTIYSKNEQSDISQNQINLILNEFIKK